MSFKPSDFYLGIVDFLGVLVPGAVLVFMQGYRILPALSNPSSVTDWTIFLGTAFITGQLLLALSELLNGLAPSVAGFFSPQLREGVDELEKAAASLLEKGIVGKTGPTVFHAALSYLRLKNGEAAAEVDRHMADYKLLRNLVAVFVTDFLASLILGPRSCARLIFDGVLAFLSFIAFARMLGWAHLLAFQYCCLIDSLKEKSGQLPGTHE
jgi:hypothetical protein